MESELETAFQSVVHAPAVVRASSVAKQSGRPKNAQSRSASNVPQSVAPTPRPRHRHDRVPQLHFQQPAPAEGRSARGAAAVATTTRRTAQISNAPAATFRSARGPAPRQHPSVDRSIVGVSHWSRGQQEQTEGSTAIEHGSSRQNRLDSTYPTQPLQSYNDYAALHHTEPLTWQTFHDRMQALLFIDEAEQQRKSSLTVFTTTLAEAWKCRYQLLVPEAQNKRLRSDTRLSINIPGHPQLGATVKSARRGVLELFDFMGASLPQGVDRMPIRVSARVENTQYTFTAMLQSVATRSYTFTAPASVPKIRERSEWIIQGDYRMRVVEVSNGRVCLEPIKTGRHGETFEESFQEGSVYTLQESINRLLIDGQHWALRTLSSFRSDTIFPSMTRQVASEEVMRRAATSATPEPHKLTFDARLNEQQRDAVACALFEEHTGLHVIAGPAKTGKTTVLTEIILHLDAKLSSSHSDQRILVCAPSNRACDELTLALAQHVPAQRLLRLNAPSRRVDECAAIKPYSWITSADDMQRFVIPSSDELVATIIICTCTTAVRLHMIGVISNAFDYLCVDDAGLATEPELVVPIAVSLHPGLQIVLAGDPTQTAVAVTSKDAARWGLSTSTLKRLCEKGSKDSVYSTQEPVVGNTRYLSILSQRF